MRIISGIRRGHKLLEFEGMDVRPTTDRVKESIFNLIQSYIPDSVCLDMFSGSGALSFEAISRGASKAVMLDNDKRSVDIIRKNAQSLKFGNFCEIRNEDAFEYAGRAAEKFDIIFLDPPYNKGYVKPVLCEIVKHKLLNDEGIVMLESDDTDFSAEVQGLTILKQRKYGRTCITIYQKEKETNENSSLSG